jgi:hypothetical protein
MSGISQGGVTDAPAPHGITWTFPRLYLPKTPLITRKRFWLQLLERLGRAVWLLNSVTTDSASRQALQLQVMKNAGKLQEHTWSSMLFG